MINYGQHRLKRFEIDCARVIAAFTLTLLFASVIAASPAAIAQNHTVYAITGAGIFGTLNLTTGAFTEIGNSAATLAGLGALGGAVYGGVYNGDTLEQVNLSNGRLTPVGAASFNFADFGSTTSSLYATSFASNGHNLYSINAGTGLATLIGPIGLPQCYCGMSSGGSTLYFASDTGSGAVLYSLDTTTGAANFIGNTGVSDIDSMIVVAGVLYANTEAGVLYTLDTTTGEATFVANTGVDLFGMALPTTACSKLHDFTGARDGATPTAGVTIDQNGNLYGTTVLGGRGFGAVYALKLRNGSYTLNPLYNFTGGADGANPYARVVFEPNVSGILYGTTFNGGQDGNGVVFKLQPAPTVCTTALCSWRETVLFAFPGGAGGKNPWFGDVIFDTSNNMYGTTNNGGDGGGVAWGLTPPQIWNTEAVLTTFTGQNGLYADGGPILDRSGNLYGTTYYSATNTGEVYQLVASDGYAVNVLHNFTDGSDGDFPIGGLVFDSSGNLYGASTNGGAGGGGVIFELSPQGTWTSFTPLYTFSGSGTCTSPEGTYPGPGPWAVLTMDTAGNLYGTTCADGTHGYGNVFELTPSDGGWNYIDLYDFTGGTDGGHPFSNVSMYNGNLYGTASTGGSNGFGVVWEITP